MTPKIQIEMNLFDPALEHTFSVVDVKQDDVLWHTFVTTTTGHVEDTMTQALNQGA
jgi:hypothetical protein